MFFSTNKCIFAAQNKYQTMNKEDEVSLFLKRFKDKAKIFGIVFRDDRGKNTQALLDLEITALKRLEIIMNIEVNDFVEDTLNKVADLWVFGKKVKSQDVYIKISMGIANNSAVCISFHIAEYKLVYQFK